MILLSIIILTYNSQNYIERLIESLFKFLKKEIQTQRIEIIVADNNSKDKTLDIVKKYKEIKIIENRENLGFSRGINLGVGKSKGEYIAVINPDTEFKKGNIFELIDLFKKDRKIGVAAGRIINTNGKYEKSAGRFLKTFEIFLMSLGLDELFGIRVSPKKTTEVDFVNGAFMIVRKDLFEKLSGFDENLFMYLEDMEFCYRAKKKGYKIIFDPKIEIIHHSHGSSSRSFAIKNIFKGLLYFQKKHGSYFSYFMVRLMLGSKALILSFIGKIINNSYLSDTYSNALKT